MMVRIVAVLSLLLGLLAGSVQAGCLVFCDEGTVAPAEARAYLEAELAAPLPDGVEVVTLQEGGFQDTFIEAELIGHPDAITAVLAMMAIDSAAMGPMQADGFGAAVDPVWSLQPGMALKGAEGTLGHFAFARAAMTTVPEADGRVRLFIFAFET